MIKVIANSTEQAIEIIQAFENSDAKIVVDIKENNGVSEESTEMVIPLKDNIVWVKGFLDILHKENVENSDNSFILPKQKLETLKIDLENKAYEINGINLSNMRVSHVKYEICGIEHSIEIIFEDMLGNKFSQKFNNFF
ncbi:hypothetical protein G7059_01610 [Erysipelothrix sp. HDW6A]|uniref:hypothetical protein n=1 Tax=Erysipelothrix sp. HDW6A TaxID=2714928 RepID=UPI001407B033|nr:hypothetical protein [Erysipelothrix sp. HDW6A]QIK56632.1 hypothetical protein G7059_01610 [Erysipelothrix sp. HDW6A]